MRLTNKLFAQHLGRHFKRHWKVQGQRVPRDTGAESALISKGFEVKNVQEVVKEVRQQLNFEVIGPIATDSTHPNCNASVCHSFGNTNVLLEGMAQAQNLIKTIVINDLPKQMEESLNSINISSTTVKSVQQSILSSHVFDAEQQKLPLVKIPERPMFVLPRTYGITHPRRNRLLISKLVFECEKLAGRDVNTQRKIVNNADFIFTMTKNEKKIQFDLGAELLITSRKPLSKVQDHIEGEIPDIFPISETISIPMKNIYLEEELYPIKSSLYGYPHTIFNHFSLEDVRNIHETPVTSSQFKSRNMLKAFTVAASKSRQLYGPVQQLPEPIVVQSIQTDGKSFHFGIFQLNTLNLNGIDGLKNYWFQLESMDLFKECGVKEGKPTLQGFNKDVFRVLTSFYNNC